MWKQLIHVLSKRNAYTSAGLLSAMATASHLRAPLHCEGNADDLVALHPKEWRKFRVTQVQPLTSNVKRIRFALDSPDHEMGLPVASCLLARAKISGKYEVRPYTPTTSNEEKGLMELVVKGYEQGKVSKFIVNLQIGDELEMKGPFKKYPYRPNTKAAIGMIAGGSGITPMVQVVKEVLRNADDTTQVRLLFANVSEEDIILRNELDALAYMYPDRFQVAYCLDTPPENWDGYSGYITKEMVEEFLPPPSQDNLMMVCGPPPMMFHISGNKAKDKSQGELECLLREMNYTSSMVFKF